MMTAFPHADPGKPLTVDGTKRDYHLVAAHGTIFNYSGHPAAAIPTGPGENGLPIGLQLVARRWGEETILRAAMAISALIGGFERPLGY
jgi:amidase